MADMDLSVNNKSDWGYCIEGVNSKWFTLSKQEWLYLVTSSGRTNGRYYRGLATIKLNNIDDVYGLVILPDESDTDIINNLLEGYSDNEYSMGDWLKMEDMGAVFLPAAGKRSGYAEYYYLEAGHYWSTSYDEDNEEYAVSYSFNDEGMDIPSESRHAGQSVRLVYDINSK